MLICPVLLNKGLALSYGFKNKSSFLFLAEHDLLFVELTSGAEHAFSSDPKTTLIKLRQLGKALAQQYAVLISVEFDEKTTQSDPFLGMSGITAPLTRRKLIQRRNLCALA
ncbi:hypothetical protein [Vibrio parahaemolyticus]|nr:hypothetical protein [Vibrio parahaemolyticus]EJL6724579.1 hypothetical protein [Vibrio alginolyticus]EKA2633441.1 hypothetical protein [Vibrio alginolyticus]ELA9732440.1 hypothetical protein [Vibrio alginolyticus]MDA0392712.1 hypothetical protein [Vibrio parahaemolyticus]MDA0397900.1 hypothetical protein [Vibrio parahaemolyticus]